MRNSRHIYRACRASVRRTHAFRFGIEGATISPPQRALGLRESLQTRLRTTQNQRMDVVSAFVGIHRL
jgi:hypothetical protein